MGGGLIFLATLWIKSCITRLLVHDDQTCPFLFIKICLRLLGPREGRGGTFNFTGSGGGDATTVYRYLYTINSVICIAAHSLTPCCSTALIT